MNRRISKNTLLVHIPQHLIFMLGVGEIAYYKISVIWLIFSYLSWIVLGYFGFSVFYHRYFAHRAFKMNLLWENLWAYLGLLVGRGSPINMASVHCAEHHAFSDKSADPHSPSRGVLWSWFLWTEYHDFKISYGAAKHLFRNKFIIFLDRNYLYIFWVTFILLFLVNWKIAVFGMMGAGVLHFHIEGAVNTLCHLPQLGKQDFLTKDNSRNIRGLFNIVLLGTGLHNNHHAFPRSYHYALCPGDFDLAKYIVPFFIKGKNEV